MAQLKAGSRLRSAVCATEVMVIAAPVGADIQVTCGGASMIAPNETPAAGATLAPDASKGTVLGKRYVNQAGTLELLCTKPGAGSLGLGGELLVLKEAKALPSSD